jgi:hypothetical protein
MRRKILGELLRRQAAVGELIDLAVCMPDARAAVADDLDSLLALFGASEVSAHAEPHERAAQIWSDTLSDDNVVVFVSDA